MKNLMSYQARKNASYNWQHIVGLVTIFLVHSLLQACNTTNQVPTVSIATKTISTPINLDKKHFTINTANKILPEGVLREVQYSPGGGSISCPNDDTEQPKIQYPQDSVEWLRPIDIVVCNWKNPEPVQMKLVLPNGKIISEQLLPEIYIDRYWILYTYFPEINDPSGNYLFTFSSQSINIEHTVNVVEPKDPRMYYIQKAQAIYLYNFDSQERIRLFYYNVEELLFSFVGYQEFHVNHDGTLIIEIDAILLEQGDFVSIGDSSSAVNLSGLFYLHPRLPEDILQVSAGKNDFTCQNALPTRLKIKDYAYIASNPPLPNRVRIEVGISNEEIGQVEPGGVVELIDGPKCADDIVWWKVKVINSTLVGWTAEGDETYYLNPCTSKNSCP